MTDYMKIDWADVREGDVLMHPDGDRLTVEKHDPEDHTVIYVLGQLRLWRSLDLRGFTPHRKRPELPTEPGAYLDKDGATWLLDEDSDWFSSDSFLAWGDGDSMAEDMAARAPFTRLVPMPTEADVLDAIEAPELLDHRSLAEDRAAAVMALLRGGDDD